MLRKLASRCIYKGFQFALKGGTSLSKGFNIIERFSEDIDIQIYPREGEQVPTNNNQDKPRHIEFRHQFFAKVTQDLNIVDISFRRDTNFDDHKKMRSAGIRGEYSSLFTTLSALKEGVVLEYSSAIRM